MSAYTTVSNQAIDDDQLSPMSLGLLVWLLRQPSTTGISVTKMREALNGVGSSAIRKAIHQLEERGYLRRVRVHENGRYKTGEYVVTDSPEA